MADKEEKNSDNHAGANLRGRGAQPFGQAPDQKDGSGGKVAKPGGVKWRDGFNRITDGEIGRAPDDVGSEKGESHQEAARGRRSFGPRGGCFYAFDCGDCLLSGHRIFQRSL